MASLQPGIRIVNAPRFHSARSWSDRLCVNTGVVEDSGRVFARDDWRAPTEDEIRLLTVLDEKGDAGDELALFNIPERLHAQWWTLAADPAADSEAGRAAFQQYAGAVLEYLHFKRLPLPPACTLEVVLHAPGQASTRPNLGGLSAPQAGVGILGGINLGDEESALIFLNRLPAQSLLTPESAYPLIKIRLRPGEGFWLPRSPIVIDGDTRGREEVDVQLVIRTKPTNES